MSRTKSNAQRIDLALRTAARQFARRRLTTPFLDAEVLLAHAQKISREYLAAHPEHVISSAQLQRFWRLVAARSAGVPVAYLRGHQEFYGLRFAVNRSVLIPRPETETLVDAVIAAARRFRRPRIADIGTGCGNIAVALAHHVPLARIFAVDRSSRAIRLARINAESNARPLFLDREKGVAIRFFRGDLLEPLKAIPLNIVVANLPYLPSRERGAAKKFLRWEPPRALWSGRDGLNCYRRLFSQLANRVPPRYVVCELRREQLSDFLAIACHRLSRHRAQVIPAGGDVVAVCLHA